MLKTSLVLGLGGVRISEFYFLTHWQPAETRKPAFYPLPKNDERQNLLDQRTVDAACLNASKNRLSRVRDDQMAFSWTRSANP